MKIEQKLLMSTLTDLVERGLIKVVSVEHLDGELIGISVNENVYSPSKVTVTFESTENRKIDISMSGGIPVLKIE